MWSKFFYFSLMCFSLFMGSGLYAQEKDFLLGESQGWDGVELFNLQEDLGKRGYVNLELRDQEYVYEGSTDLLMHFNRVQESLPARYELKSSSNVAFSEGALGGFAASFSSIWSPLVLLPKRGSLFEVNNVIGDFSIEFRMLPNTLTQRENVFYWKNVRLEDDKLIHQYIVCSIENREVTWKFINFFQPKGGGEYSVSLVSRTRLIPGAWVHQLISYDSKLGKLVYKLDGVIEDIAFTTDTGKQRGVIYSPRVGENVMGTITIGREFSGLIDELRIEERVVDAPFLTRYSGNRGVLLTDPIDLGYTNSKVLRVDVSEFLGKDSGLFFYYRISNRREDNLLWGDDLPVNYAQIPIGLEWSPVAVNEFFSDGVKGRYLQLLVEFFPDGDREFSPQLRSLNVHYMEDLPPIPPRGVHAEALDGEVRLSWNPVTDTDLAGYLIYWGEDSGFYYGNSENQDSPIDVGLTNFYTIENLENGKLYFFSIVAYDNSYKEGENGANHKSSFSQEVSARPSRIFEVGDFF